jgi:hypothetical protein
MGQRAYCDRWHPGGDAEADAWCEQHHWVRVPADPDELELTGAELVAEHTGRPITVDGFPYTTTAPEREA